MQIKKTTIKKLPFTSSRTGLVQVTPPTLFLDFKAQK